MDVDPPTSTARVRPFVEDINVSFTYPDPPAYSFGHFANLRHTDLDGFLSTNHQSVSARPGPSQPAATILAQSGLPIPLVYSPAVPFPTSTSPPTPSRESSPEPPPPPPSAAHPYEPHRQCTPAGDRVPPSEQAHVSQPRRSTRARTVRVRRAPEALTAQAAAAAALSREQEEQARHEEMTSTAEPAIHGEDESDDELQDEVDDPMGSTVFADSPSCEDFPLLPPSPPASELYENSHSHALVRLALLTTAVLHVSHRLSHRACGLLLLVFSFIFLATNIIPPNSRLPLTLKTVLHRFELDDRFKILPVCANCHALFRPNTDTRALCPHCDTPLFRPSLFYNQIFGRKKRRQPYLTAPIRTLSSLLIEFLSHPGIEAACEAWKARPSTPGSYSHMSDGAVWNDLKGPDGRCFFDRDDPQDGELRLGVTFSLDW